MSDPAVFERIRGDIGETDVVVFMKGTPVFPQCGFSATVVQALSNLVYYGLALVPDRYVYMVGAILVENLSQGLATAAFVAFLMSLCSRAFSATQYALLSSLNAVSRDVMVAPAGRVAEAAGWPAFFLMTLVAALPGMLLLLALRPWRVRSGMVATPSADER